MCQKAHGVLCPYMSKRVRSDGYPKEDAEHPRVRQIFFLENGEQTGVWRQKMIREMQAFVTHCSNNRHPRGPPFARDAALVGTSNSCFIPGIISHTIIFLRFVLDCTCLQAEQLSFLPDLQTRATYTTRQTTTQHNSQRAPKSMLKGKWGRDKGWQSSIHHPRSGKNVE